MNQQINDITQLSCEFWNRNLVGRCDYACNWWDPIGIFSLNNYRQKCLVATMGSHPFCSWSWIFIELNISQKIRLYWSYCKMKFWKMTREIVWETQLRLQTEFDPIVVAQPVAIFIGHTRARSSFSFSAMAISCSCAGQNLISPLLK